MIQMTHMGRRTNWDHSDWLPILSSSPIREIAHKAFPKEAEDWDINRVIDDFVKAAERIDKAGLDGFEISCSGTLMDQFYSPITNKRDDEWNGSLENRLKLLQTVIKSIREYCGYRMVIGCRLTLDERLPGGAG